MSHQHKSVAGLVCTMEGMLFLAKCSVVIVYVPLVASRYIGACTIGHSSKQRMGKVKGQLKCQNSQTSFVATESRLVETHCGTLFCFIVILSSFTWATVYPHYCISFTLLPVRGRLNLIRCCCIYPVTFWHSTSNQRNKSHKNKQISLFIPERKL